jgi:hypothetical protein
MPKVTKLQKQACDTAQKALRKNKDVVSVGIGYRYRNGKRTDEIVVVIGVKKKLPPDQVPPGQMIMDTVNGVPTDVVEYGEIKPHDVMTQALTERRRPCPPGYSISHPEVTAGTLGAWVRRGSGQEYYILSNNHVVANSNDTSLGISIWQPGRADGGSAADQFARLTEYVRIRFDNEQNGNGNGNGKKSSSSFAWRAWKWPANFLADLLGCPYRLVVARPNQLDQPYPNLVDAALAQVIVESNVELDIPEIGEIQGIADLQLGDRVQKTGRTTEHTTGMVEVVGAESVVNYGPGKGDATFADQIVIRADSGDFSAGGDSGSAILTEDNVLGGLLFAGGSGVTIANKISNVVSLLGIRL